MKKVLLISAIILVGSGLIYLLMYEIPKNDADRAIDKLIAKQNVRRVKVKKSKIEKAWKTGDFYKFVDYSDDKNSSYQYMYSAGSNWKNHMRVFVTPLDENKKPKYYYDFKY